jgi:hypothetical protein
MTALKLAQANAIIETAIAEGRKRHFAPLRSPCLMPGDT